MFSVNGKMFQKQKVITLNDVVKKVCIKLGSMLNEPNERFDDNDFISQKGSVYKTQSINDVLKTIFDTKKLQILSHSFPFLFLKAKIIMYLIGVKGYVYF